VPTVQAGAAGGEGSAGGEAGAGTAMGLMGAMDKANLQPGR